MVVVYKWQCLRVFVQLIKGGTDGTEYQRHRCSSLATDAGCLQRRHCISAWFVGICGCCWYSCLHQFYDTRMWTLLWHNFEHWQQKEIHFVMLHVFIDVGRRWNCPRCQFVRGCICLWETSEPYWDVFQQCSGLHGCQQSYVQAVCYETGQKQFYWFTWQNWSDMCVWRLTSEYLITILVCIN